MKHKRSEKKERREEKHREEKHKEDISKTGDTQNSNQPTNVNTKAWGMWGNKGET